MKKNKINLAYWITLMILSIGFLFSAIPSILKLPYAVEYFTNVLKLPEYLLFFTGIIKLLGLVVLYVPGFPRLKEWVFAGFAFNLLGAWYCNVAALHSYTAGIPVVIYLAILFLLYYLYERKKIMHSSIISEPVNQAM